MPRHFDSFADAVASSSRPKARAAAAAAARETRDAARSKEMARAATRRWFHAESELGDVVTGAEKKLHELRTNLLAARARAEHLDDLSYRNGTVHAEVVKVRAQVDGLPRLIERAERELDAAHHALAAHRTAMHAAFAAAEHAEDETEDAAEPQAEPVPAALRGRGRPPKVPA